MWRTYRGMCETIFYTTTVIMREEDTSAEKGGFRNVSSGAFQRGIS